MPASKKSIVTVIIGLGNPGEAYRTTYHNAGRIALETMVREAAHAEVPKQRRAHHFLSWHCGTFVAIAPTVFMNESGEAVLSALRTLRRKPGELLVIHDDSDIALGNYKFTYGRGPAGHRGVGSIIAALGTKNFWRLRLGIRTTEGRAAAFVLKKMRPADRETLQSVIEKSTRKLTEKVNPSGPVLTSVSGNTTSRK